MYQYSLFTQVLHMLRLARGALDAARLDEFHLRSYKHDALELLFDHATECVHFSKESLKASGLSSTCTTMRSRPVSLSTTMR